MPAPRPGTPNRWLLAAGAGTAAVLVLAVAAIALVLGLKPQGTIDRMVPATVDAYVAAYVDPSLTQKASLFGLAHRFPSLKTDADITKNVNQWLDKAFEPTGISFSADVRPWLGSQVDVVTRGVDKTAIVALLAASKDDARASAALAKLRAGPEGRRLAWTDETYQGVAIAIGTPTQNALKEPVVYALVGHAVILSSSEALVKEIIDTNAGKAPRLIDSPGFREAQRMVASDRLAFAYVNGKTLAKTVSNDLTASAQNPLGADLTKLNELDAAQTIAFALVARSNGLVADLEVKVDPSRLDASTKAALAASGDAGSMAAWIPANAYGFAATATLKPSLQALADSLASDATAARDLESYGITGPHGVLANLTGEAALSVGPGRGHYPDGSVLIGTSDRAGMERFLQRLTDTLVPLAQGQTTGVTASQTTYRGAAITTLVVGPLRDAGYAPSYTVTQGFAIIGSSPGEVKAVLDARASGASIATTDHYRAAATQALTHPSGIFYVDIGALAAAVHPLVSGTELGQYDRKLTPWLGPLMAVISTSRGGSSRLSEGVFILITSTSGNGGTQG